ncbi:copper-binding protein NosD [Flavobacterium chryseum]|uniref:T9SS type A sorting domain-containing protein n=1 Tax=Flavobacterium sp. P3160 TaxID=2512113 RepID=UPI00106164EC|nr:T9SS type A sorting domain-containing protein [Flavobacterium sp. P3160]TDO73472.1 copper-binding protein NosD [Flavobacterium sp. P3160]
MYWLIGNNTVIEKNIVYNSYYGIYSGQNSPNIINNTIISCDFGIYLNDNEIANTSPKINSNIIAYNSKYAIYSEGKPKPSQVIYNLFYGNNLIGNNNLPIGTGTIITINKNGTPSDTYFNLISNPELSSTSPFDKSFCELLSSSKAINAGDPGRKDSDESIVDIGARSYGQTLSVIDNNYKNNSLIVYPNPMRNYLNFESKIGLKEISVYNIIGLKIDSVNFENEQFNYKWDLPSHLMSGLYVYILKNINNEIFTGKILKQ